MYEEEEIDGGAESEEDESDRDAPIPGRSPGKAWSTWKSDAAAAREQQLESARRWGVGIVAALVLLPLETVLALCLIAGAVYMCISAARSIKGKNRRDRGKSL